MRITASRKDDLIRERDEWDAANKAQREKHDAQFGQYRSAVKEICDSVKADLEQYLPKNSCQLDIKVGPDFRADDRLKVDISGNSANRRDDDVAISWEWNVYVDTQGNVQKESNSWSGLKAVTEEQLQSLRDTLEILERLNSIDWKVFLDKAVPNYSDYITEKSSIGQRPDFEGDISKAELDELVGQNVAVSGYSSGRGYRDGVKVWYKLLKKSGSQYTVSELSNFDIESAESSLKAFEDDARFAFRINADRLLSLIPSLDNTMELN